MQLFDVSLRSLIREKLGEGVDRILCISHCAQVFNIFPNELFETVSAEELLLSASGEDAVATASLHNTVIDTLQSKMNEKLRPKEFLSGILSHPGKDALIDAFLFVETLRFSILGNLIRCFDVNVSIVGEYRNRLTALKTQTTKRDKWGDIDESGWVAVLQEFAKDKMVGSSFEAFLDDLPVEINQHLETVNQNNSLARFAWICYQLNIKSKFCKPANADETPLPVTGEDYEIQIKNTLESALDWVVVETTPRTGDHGADLIVHGKGRRVAIQAKYYTGNVGNAAVQEIYAAKDFYDASFAAVVTSSSYTGAARVLASKLGVVLAFDDDIVDIVANLLE